MLRTLREAAPAAVRLSVVGQRFLGNEPCKASSQLPSIVLSNGIDCSNGNTHSRDDAVMDQVEIPIKTSQSAAAEVGGQETKLREALKTAIVCHISNLRNRSDPKSEILIQTDDSSAFFKESTRYLSHVRLQHRLLKRLGYNVYRVPWYEWNKLGCTENQIEYIDKMLDDKFPQYGRHSEWLDDDDEKDAIKRKKTQQLRICKT